MPKRGVGHDAGLERDYCKYLIPFALVKSPCPSWVILIPAPASDCYQTLSSLQRPAFQKEKIYNHIVLLRMNALLLILDHKHDPKRLLKKPTRTKPFTRESVQ